MLSGPTVEMVERLRQTILEKEKQFFYRRRAVNGEYIFGRRKGPFGVINFPEEMRRWKLPSPISTERFGI